MSTKDNISLEPLPHDLFQKELSIDECEPPWSISHFEDTLLHSLISLQTRAGMKQAYDHILKMRSFEFKKRSLVDQSTYLHLLLDQAPTMHKKYAMTTDLIPLIYQLALKGVVVNAQNKHGNTCLHLACLRPHANSLCQHLLRVGVDPCIPNKHNCRVVHTVLNNIFRIVKGESDVRSGLWFAVQHEDMQLVERLMQCWCRVDVARNKTFLDLAEETGNNRLVCLLHKYRLVNEMVCAAFACDIPLLNSIVKLGPIDFKTTNEAYFPARPLVVCLGALGYWSQHTIKVLLEHGATTAEDFKAKELEHMESFEKSEFYKLVEEETRESLNRASDLVLEKKVELELMSYRKERLHWNYLHYVVDRWRILFTKDREKAREYTKCVYRMTIAGINVNSRTADRNTALLIGAQDNNQIIINHLLRIGCDSTITNANGECVAVERYYGCGQLVLTRKCRPRDLPGLHAAVKTNNLQSAVRWLKIGCRVNCKRGDRFLTSIAQSFKQTRIVELLKQYHHINEFVCATFASDAEKVRNIIALGDGFNKMNAVDEYYPTGMIVNYRCEYIHRPLVIGAIIFTEPHILDFLLKFKADLTCQYEEKPPCGPLALWSFQASISNISALVVVRYAEVTLRDELGCTMLHRIIAKDRVEGKLEIVRVLLARNINIAARDENGYTARDYTFLYSDLDKSNEIRQILDDHVLDLVKLDNLIEVEQLVLNAYNHILDIRDSNKKRTAMEIAESKQYYNMQTLFKKMDSYFNEINMLQNAVIEGDMRAVAKHAMEKKCAQCITIGGKTLVHLAVLFEKYEVLVYLLDYFPNLINRADNIGRTALHYCVCLEDRLTFWPPLQDSGAEPAMTDSSNLSVYDYVKQLKNPVPIHMKSRARQWRDYKPTLDFVEKERIEVLKRLNENSQEDESVSKNDVLKLNLETEGTTIDRSRHSFNVFKNSFEKTQELSFSAETIEEMSSSDDSS